MEHEQEVIVFDKTGRRGTLGQQVTDRDTGSSYQTVVLEDGRSVLVLSNLLVQREDGSMYVPVDLHAMEQQRNQRGSFANTGSTATETNIIDGDQLVIPVVEETVEVGKRTIEHAVRVHKHVRETEQELRETLLSEAVEIERVPVNQVVDAAQGIRQEGDLVIVPVYEEVAVIEKRLVLKEEIRMRLSQQTTDWRDRVVLRHEEIEIEREAGSDNLDTNR